MTKRADLAERDLRFKRIREAMERGGLDALVVTGHGSHFNRGYIRYFADWHLWAGDALILIPLAGEPALAMTAYAGADTPAEAWITDVRRAVYPQEKIVEVMKEKGLTMGKVGIAGLKRIITVGAYETLKNTFPNVEFVDADVMVDRVRMVKSPFEIQQYRDLWALSKAAMERFIEVLEPGKTQREVAAEVAKVLRAGGCFDDMTVIQEGTRRGLPQDVPLRCDDLVGYHMEVCGESSHWSEIDITCAFREMTELEQKRMDSELRAYDEIREMAKPGVKLSDMANVFDRVLIEDGWELGEQSIHFDFHGHGMDDVQWPWYSPKPDHNQDVAIEEGMILCYHPRRNTIPAVAWGPRITDDILITANGAERLSGDWDLRWRIMR
jgi:Xaa-Pro aminopeptidase